MVAIVLGRRSGNADIWFTYIPRTADMILVCGPTGPIVSVAVVASGHRRISGSFGERHLPLMARLWGLGVTQNIRALQDTVGDEASRSRAGDAVRLPAGRRRDIDGEFRTPRHRLRGPGSPAAHDGARLSVVDVVVVGGGAQVSVVDAGRGHGITVRTASCPAGTGGRMGRSVNILHLE